MQYDEVIHVAVPHMKPINKTQMRWLLSVAAGACSLALLPDSAACVLVDAVSIVGDAHLGELIATAGAFAIVP
jgi:hypothetical protein